MYRPCVVIPVYNHPQVIDKVVYDIIGMGYPCIVVDDGSDDVCRSVLRKLAEADDNIHLIRLEANQGKGIAVCTGLRFASNNGFSHALQVDADGQHNLKDIPHFFALSHEHKDSVITGSRISDTIPASRRYGRALTDILVWLHTLSLQVDDSMCGFRVYPLKQTTALLDRINIGKRMDFDTDILVRLYWSGIRVQQVSTRVVYAKDIVSHFNMLADNIRMTIMHIRLFFGMIVRIPKLVKRNILTGNGGKR